MIVYCIDWEFKDATDDDWIEHYSNWDRNLKDSYEDAIERIKFFHWEFNIKESKYGILSKVEIPDGLDWNNITPQEDCFEYEDFPNPDYKIYTGLEEIQEN